MGTDGPFGGHQEPSGEEVWAEDPALSGER